MITVFFFFFVVWQMKLKNKCSLNLNKTSLIGIYVIEDEVADWARELNCHHDSLPINYLGFPLGRNHHCKGFWDPLIDRLRAKLDDSRCLFLSKGSMVKLAQFVLNSMPIYWFSLLKAPKAVTSLWKKLLETC